MVKRELIDRKQAVEVVSNGFDRWHMINLLASQESIPAITEQEIVKPYLDKIRAEIMDCLKALDDIEKSGFNIYLPNEMTGRRLTYQQCLEFIDKYKAESEG